MNWSDRWSVMIGIVITSGVAGAEPAKTVAVQCKIAGARVALGEVHDALVATPDGRLVVFAGDGTLHAYRARAGSACVLEVDRTFGHAGVIDTGLGSDFVWARLDVDSNGTLYANAGDKRARIEGGRVTPMCGDGFVAASPRSPRHWRWFAINDATHETGACTGGTHANFSADPNRFLGSLWALDDDRVVVSDDPDYRLYGGNSKTPVKLDDPHTNRIPVRFLACGDAICGLDDGHVVAWNAKGHELGSVDLDTLTKLNATSWVGFALIGQKGYSLATVDGQAALIRLDGITTWNAKL